MFRPYLAIFRQMFTFTRRNCHIALDLKSLYFYAIALLLFTQKYVWERNSLVFPHYLTYAASMFLYCIIYCHVYGGYS
jgi:hypothetical protein